MVPNMNEPRDRETKNGKTKKIGARQHTEPSMIIKIQKYAKNNCKQATDKKERNRFRPISP